MQNCHECKHHRPIPGDAHYACHHPVAVKDQDNAMASLMAIFAGVQRVDPIVSPALLKLGIELDGYGVRSGWANWPWNFDPVWISGCTGFEEYAKPEPKAKGKKS